MNTYYTPMSKEIFKLIVEDVQDVAGSYIDRQLTDREIEIIERKIELDWITAIENTIDVYIKQEEEDAI